MDFSVYPVKSLRGKVSVPGDKSISHRAVMFGSLAEGTTEVDGFLPGEDCLSTLHCFEQMGIEIERTEKTKLKIYGRGLFGFKEPEDVLDAGNSGTTMRLMLGILAGQNFYSVITGDSSLRKRPMDRVIIPLKKMGAQIWGRGGNSLAPISILGRAGLQSITYETPVASAQVKSAVLFAGLFAEGTTTVSETFLSRDHTEKMLEAFGGSINFYNDHRMVSVEGKPALKGRNIRIPGDISSASFFIVAGCIVPDSEIYITGTGINYTRSGILDVLREMGAEFELQNERKYGEEPAADILVRTSRLTPAVIKADIVPRLIDEIPVLAVAACFAEGRTLIKGAGELRVKESDRLKIIAGELKRMGAEIEELDDGLIIDGPVRLKGAECDSHGDHRVAMALAVAGLAAEGKTKIKGFECVDISFPGFYDTLSKLFE